MLLPAIVLMPSPSHSYNVNGHTYASDGSGLVYSAATADIGGLTAFGGVLLAPRNNTSLLDPTNANDYTQLYGVGSLWENTAGIRLWMCTAMGSTPGTATWTQIAANAGVLSGDGGGVTVKPTGASTARTLANLFADAYNNVKTFGAVGNGSTDDTAAIAAAITEAGLNGGPVYFPTGVYKVTSSINVDLNALGATSQGIWLVGDGMNRSVIDGSISGGITTLYIYGSGGAPLAQTNCFFGGVRDLGIKANYAGPAFQIGTYNFADALNAFNFQNVNVKNTSTSSSALGTQIFYVLNSVFSNLISNTGGIGTGIALELNQAAFNNFVGGSFSSAQTGVHITNGFNFSNVFHASDVEVVTNCVLNDSINGNGHNVFIGGQFVWTAASSYAVVSSVPVGLGRVILDNVNFAPSTGSGDLFIGKVVDPNNNQGVFIRGNYGDGTTPAGGAPGSGVQYQNLTGVAMQVIVYPGSGTTGMSVTLQEDFGSPFTIADATNGPVTVTMRPRMYITVNWSTTPVGWVWLPLPN